jgi:hypothetical protein
MWSEPRRKMAAAKVKLSPEEWKAIDAMIWLEFFNAGNSHGELTRHSTLS